MKNLLLGLVLVVITAASALAQTDVVKTQLFNLTSASNGTSTDTVQTGFLTKIQTSPRVLDIRESVAVQVVVTKISGTVAGVVRLFGSIDGATFARIIPTDSLIVPNVATASKVFVLPSYPYTHLRVEYIGAGTMSAKLSSRALYKRK